MLKKEKMPASDWSIEIRGAEKVYVWVCE